MTRLLLIDDDETTREVLSLLLAGEGWVVTSASGGDEAVRIARTMLPEAILSDLQMPGLSGAELGRALREACAVAPVMLAMTATRGGDAPEGFDALLVKPFAPSDVRTMCEAVHGGVTVETLRAGAEDAAIAEDTFERMRRSMPLEQLRSLYAFALYDAEMRVARMSAAADAEDETAFRREAHALKGSCGMIGAERLRGLAADAEEHGISCAAMALPYGQRFRNAIHHVRLMLEELLSAR